MLEFLKSIVTTEPQPLQAEGKPDAVFFERTVRVLTHFAGTTPLRLDRGQAQLIASLMRPRDFLEGEYLPDTASAFFILDGDAVFEGVPMPSQPAEVLATASSGGVIGATNLLLAGPSGMRCRASSPLKTAEFTREALDSLCSLHASSAIAIVTKLAEHLARVLTDARTRLAQTKMMHRAIEAEFVHVIESGTEQR